jgi:enoyl-CoA hydratase/carnithine racemase
LGSIQQKTILRATNVVLRQLEKRKYSTADSIFEDAKRSDYSISSRTASWLEKGLKFENIDHGVSRLTFTRDETKNALSTPLISTLLEALRLLAEKNEEKSVDAPKVVILSGEGSYFSSGIDISELQRAKNEEELRLIFNTFTQLVETFRRLPLVVISQIHARCEGEGLQLVGGSDLAIASKRATFSLPGSSYGLINHMAAVNVLRSSVHKKKVFEMLLTGETITAREALEYGLLNTVVDEDRLEDETLQVAKKIARLEYGILGLAKKTFHAQAQMPFEIALPITEEAMLENIKMEQVQMLINAKLRKK